MTFAVSNRMKALSTPVGTLVAAPPMFQFAAVLKSWLAEPSHSLSAADAIRRSNTQHGSKHAGNQPPPAALVVHWKRFEPSVQPFRPTCEPLDMTCHWKDIMAASFSALTAPASNAPFDPAQATPGVQLQEIRHHNPRQDTLPCLQGRDDRVARVIPATLVPSAISRATSSSNLHGLRAETRRLRQLQKLTVARMSVDSTGTCMLERMSLLAMLAITEPFVLAISWLTTVLSPRA